jgi:hypothetical protein
VSTSVPLSGFLNLSAVSWQAQGLWPCFMPLPFLGSSLQSFSLTRIARLSRGPLSRSLAPLQLSTGELKRAVLRRSQSVSFDVHAFTRLPEFPRRLWTSFPQTEVCFPVVLGSAQQSSLLLLASFTYFEAFIPP